jgi:hypothetical protein
MFLKELAGVPLWVPWRRTTANGRLAWVVPIGGRRPDPSAPSTWLDRQAAEAAGRTASLSRGHAYGVALALGAALPGELWLGALIFETPGGHLDPAQVEVAVALGSATASTVDGNTVVVLFKFFAADLVELEAIVPPAGCRIALRSEFLAIADEPLDEELVALRTVSAVEMRVVLAATSGVGVPPSPVTRAEDRPPPAAADHAIERVGEAPATPASDDPVEAVSAAIYNANPHKGPPWPTASDDVRRFVRRQAQAAIAAMQPAAPDGQG